MFQRILLLVIGLTFFTTGGWADQRNPVDHQTHLEQVEQASKVEFERVLQWYDDYVRDRPLDVAGSVERCRFMSAFSATFEYLDWLDEVYERQDQCGTQLREQYGDHPEVEIYELDALYGEPLQKKGRELIERSSKESWTEGQAARLYTKLASGSQSNDPNRAGEFALLALKADSAADVRLIAARKLVTDGKRDAARALLASPLDRHDPSEYWYASQKMELLMELDAYGEARAIYESLKASGATYDRVAASKLLRKMNALAEARAELASDASEWAKPQMMRERFLFEYGVGDSRQALAAYEELRDQGYETDPLGVNRVALLSRDIALPWRPRDLLGLLTAGALLLACAGLMLIPISMVHYRGLVLRERTGQFPPTTGGWHLRHAWLVLTVLAAADVVALYFAGPLDVMQHTGVLWEFPLEPQQWARMAIAGEVLALFLAIAVALAVGRPPLPWSDRWLPMKAAGLGIGLGLALRIPLLLNLLVSDALADNLLKNPVVQLVVFIRDNYSVFSSVWVLCMAAPVLEEFIFRGVLLQAFQRHISFAWANALQASLFTIAHLDVRGAPFLFICGIVAGLLVRRSQGLLAPIIMHATLNAVVAAIVLS